MTALRWILGVVTFLAGGGWLLLAFWGNGFRRSSGASAVPVGAVLGPLVVILALFASLLFPAERMLLHAAAVGVAALAIGSLSLFPKFSGAGSLGLGYCGLWMAYYALAVGSGA